MIPWLEDFKGEHGSEYWNKEYAARILALIAIAEAAQAWGTDPASKYDMDIAVAVQAAERIE